MVGKKMDAEKAFERLATKHGDLYNYALADYAGALARIDIGCPRCGRVFDQRFDNHFAGFGCPSCENRKKTKTTREAVEGFKKIHGDRYDYSLARYITARQKILIGCRDCGGVFEQTPSNHLAGQGCPACSKNGRNPLDACTLYVIRQKHPDADFDWIKIGITRKKNFKDRFKADDGIESVALQTWRFQYRREAYEAEQRILKEFDEERIRAPVNFSGATECFAVSMRRRILQAVEALEIEFKIL